MPALKIPVADPDLDGHRSDVCELVPLFAEFSRAARRATKACERPAWHFVAFPGVRLKDSQRLWGPFGGHVGAVRGPTSGRKRAWAKKHATPNAPAIRGLEPDFGHVVRKFNRKGSVRHRASKIVVVYMLPITLQSAVSRPTLDVISRSGKCKKKTSCAAPIRPEILAFASLFVALPTQRRQFSGASCPVFAHTI